MNPREATASEHRRAAPRLDADGRDQVRPEERNERGAEQ